jgi:hypothetical protein
MSEGNGGGPEQLGGGGVSVERPVASTQTPSSENPVSPTTTSATRLETEPASQGPQQAQPGGSKDDPKTVTSHPEQSSNKPINMIEILTQEFKLSEDQQKILQQKIPELKEKGIDLESFSEEDLGDPKKMGIILEIIGSEEMGLSDEQRENLAKIQETLKKAEQGEQLTEEQIQGKINERKDQLQKRIAELEEKGKKGELTEEEQEELNEAKQILSDLEEISESKLEESDKYKYKRGEIKTAMLEQKIKTYGTYAAVGMGLLLLVFAWRGLKETGGGQGRGMMG